VRLLLDTQAFLWFILAEPRLSATALGLITDPLNHKHVSPASYWEIAIKIRLGKYALPEPYQAFMERFNSRPRAERDAILGPGLMPAGRRAPSGRFTPPGTPSRPSGKRRKRK